MSGVLNDLGQTILPSVFSSLNSAGIVDTMTIKAETAATIGTGGERIKGTASDAYTGVPVSYEPLKGQRVVAGDKNVSEQHYLLTFPTHTTAGSKISVDIKTHRFITAIRGNEPAKTFRGISLGEVSGVVYELVAVKEG